MIYIDSNKIKDINFQTLRKYKKNAFFLAILLLVCSILCLVFPVYAGVALSYFTGCLFAICGIYSVVSAFAFRKESLGTFFSLFLFGIIYACMGFGFVASPILGMNFLSMMICLLFVLGGISRLTTAFKNRQMIGRYWCIFIGLLDLVIAFVWLSANESTSYVLTAMFIGLEMLFSSWIFFSLSYDFENLKKIHSDI